MSDNICQRFLRAAAEKVRKVGLARGVRMAIMGRKNEWPSGAVCMLGAMDYCGVRITPTQRMEIEKHLASLLPPRPNGEAGYDSYNNGTMTNRSPVGHIAWWSNMLATDAEEVALKLERAAETVECAAEAQR